MQRLAKSGAESLADAVQRDAAATGNWTSPTEALTDVATRTTLWTTALPITTSEPACRPRWIKPCGDLPPATKTSAPDALGLLDNLMDGAPKMFNEVKKLVDVVHNYTVSVAFTLIILAFLGHV